MTQKPESCEISQPPEGKKLASGSESDFSRHVCHRFPFALLPERPLSSPGPYLTPGYCGQQEGRRGQRTGGQFPEGLGSTLEWFPFLNHLSYVPTWLLQAPLILHDVQAEGQEVVSEAHWNPQQRAPHQEGDRLVHGPREAFLPWGLSRSPSFNPSVLPS